jgi:hypothetical protein
MVATPVAPPSRAPTADWFELLLCEVHLRTGRSGDAADRLGRLIEPQRDVTVRFGATRALATVATLAGQHERAHHLLNTAGGLATRIPSRFRGALVEGDRAVVLARQGRLNEALAVAERVLAPLVRPVSGPYQRWGRHEAASVALALSRLAGRAGDGAAAHRLLGVAGDALGPVPDPVLDAHLHLTAAGVLADDEPDDIERRLARAATVFAHTGDRPAAALVTLEHARRAHQRGLDQSAAPLYDQAASELRACGWGVEARHAEALRTALAEGQPLTFRYGNVP